MQDSRKSLFAALVMIAGGLLAFVVVLAVTGAGSDDRPLGLLDWVLLGILIGPGFGYLLKWRAQNPRRAGRR